ncbi:MAG: hypothetical protein DRO90_01315, partial [Candidatus Altiarchaeales archaeon]
NHKIAFIDLSELKHLICSLRLRKSGKESFPFMVDLWVEFEDLFGVGRDVEFDTGRRDLNELSRPVHMRVRFPTKSHLNLIRDEEI